MARPRRHAVLEGQTALVTGATSGLGLAIARAMAAAGATVAVNYRAGAGKAREIVESIAADGGTAFAVQADVAREPEVVGMFDAVIDRQGRLDILVANAGIQQDAAIAEMSLQQWQAVINVNLTGQFLCCREAVRRIRAQPRSQRSKAAGKIVCMSSVHQRIPWAGHVNYAASKGGVMLLMQSLAQEVSADGIRVNGIAPGAIRTRINEAAWSEPEALERLLQLIPYGRIGEVDDIARAAVWLASDDSDYVVGTTLFIDGGMSLYPAFRDNG